MSEFPFLIADIVTGSEMVHLKMNCEQFTSHKLSVRHCIIITLLIALLRRGRGQKGPFWRAGLNCCRVVPEATELHLVAASPHHLTDTEPFPKSSSSSVKALGSGGSPRRQLMPVWCNSPGCIYTHTCMGLPAGGLCVEWGNGHVWGSWLVFRPSVAHVCCSHQIRSTAYAWYVFQPMNMAVLAFPR